MATGTALVDFKTSLETLLSARPGLSGVVVSTQPPKDPADIKTTAGAFEAIWMGAADISWDIPTMSAGIVNLEEIIDIVVVVQVVKNTANQAATDTRLVAIVDEVLLAVQNTPDLGQAGYTRFEVTPTGGGRYEPFWLPNGSGSAGQYEIGLECVARIDAS